MWAYYGVVMNQEDMIMISGAAIVGLLLGFLYGKHASRKSQNRNISQRIDPKRDRTLENQTRIFYPLDGKRPDKRLRLI